MIDLETKLKLQAYVDNELSDREARDIAARIERDAEARTLCAELTKLRTLVAAHELEVRVPESREFYWSKIQREIVRSAAQEARSSPVQQAWWTRLLAPAAGLAVLLVTALVFIRPHTAASRLSFLHEIESPLEDTGTISFHSQSAGMTVVWVQTEGH
jgi:anti-sigma factor RsiW